MKMEFSGPSDSAHRGATSTDASMVSTGGPLRLLAPVSIGTTLKRREPAGSCPLLQGTNLIRKLPAIT